MCGILGGVNASFEKNIIQLITHRGPNSNGVYEDNVNQKSVFFGHTRLSILDLSEAGHQPMISDCGNYVIVFNGEIYNHLDLRKRLSNVNFKGHSDTETILYYLAKYGIEGVKDFNGIFAFAFLDKTSDRVFLARDPFGVKPLYYSSTNNFIFASELKVLLKLIPEAQLRLESIFTFFKLRYNPSPQTLFKEISKLEPGHFVEIDLSNYSVSKPKFFSYIPEKQYNLKEDEALEKYDYYLKRAIKRQLLADVPISILLSGGVDSALLTNLAKQVSGNNFNTYTVGYSENTDVNELADARISAKFLGTEHNEVIISQDQFSNYLPKFIEIIEEPLGSQSIFPMYYLSERIKNDGFKVVLSGQGVDEPWGGYPKYNPQQLIEKLSGYTSNMKFLKKLARNDKQRRGVNALLTKDRLSRFVEVCSVFDNDFTSQLFNKIDTESCNKEVEKLFRRVFLNLNLNEHEPLDALMFLDTRMNLSDDLLLYTDKISMYHSLEVRVPFLDIELVRFVESLPHKYKVNLFKNKILHKKLAEKYLSNEIIYRKKKHFATPREKWFKGELGRQYEEMMIYDESVFSDLFNKGFILKLFSLHRRGIYNYEKQIYNLLCFYYWIQIFEKKQAFSQNLLLD